MNETGKGTLFKPTEWDWFKLQLRLQAAEHCGSVGGISFEFGDDSGEVICCVHNGNLREILSETPDRQTLMDEYFSGWIAMGKRAISNVLKVLPGLSLVLDVERDVIFRILRDYGTAPIVCTVRNGEYRWNEDLLNNLDLPSDSS